MPVRLGLGPSVRRPPARRGPVESGAGLEGLGLTMARSSRLPRRVSLGRDYHITIVLASQTVLRELAEADDDESLDGVWDAKLGTTNGYAGTIYIHNKLTVAQRWGVYWHELLHAVNDVAAFDRDHPVVI